MKINMSILKSLYLFAIVFLIMIAGGLPLWLLSIFIIIALAAPLVRENSKKTDLDERQIYIGHLSSHIAFFVLIGLLLFVMLEAYVSKGENPEPQWYLLLIVPLVIKFLLSLFLNYGAVRAASLIAYFFAGVWLLFVVLSHGISVDTLIGVLPFLPIIAIAWFAPKAPYISGIGFILLTIGLTIFFRGWLNLDIYVRLIMYTLIPLPLLLSGIALLTGYKTRENES